MNDFLTSLAPLIISILILSSFVTQYIHLNLIIYIQLVLLHLYHCSWR